MPVDTTSETTEQQVSTVKENSLKQSKPNLPDIELPDDDPNEPTPSTSKNVLTDGLKRPLSDEVDGDKEKKIRLTEVSEGELEVTNKNDIKESHIELLLQKVSESLENTIDDESNISNKTPLPDGVDGDEKKKIRLTEVSEHKLEITNKDDIKESDFELLLQKVLKSIEKTIDDKSNVSIKTPLPDGVDGDKEKKNRLIEESEDELEVTNKDDNKISHIELLLQKVSEELENTFDDESNVNDISKDRKKNNPSDILLKILNNAEKNLNDSSEFIGNSKDTVKNAKNILTNNDVLTSNDISYLNKSSSSDNLAITENSDAESVAVVNDTQVTENISTTVNDSTVRESNSDFSNTKIYTIENIVNSKKYDANPLLELKNKIHLTKNIDETKSIESPSNSNINNSEMVDICSNGIDQHFEVIDSVNSSNLGSNISLSDLTNLPEDISSIKSAVKQITKESSPQFLKLYNNKELTCEQFESMCSQKVTEIMASELFWGNNVFSELKLLKENEKLWHEKCCSLNEEFKELKHFLNIHKQEGCSMKLPKQAISLPRPDSVSIAVEDDDDDVVELEFETVESASSSTSKITNTTKKKNGDSEKTITYLELSKNPSSSSSSFITGTASRSPRRTSVLNKYTINTSPNSQKLKPILTEVSPPVPGIPNQRSLSTWKGLPPAPHLTILKSPEVQNMPQALVLSWTMNVNGTIAEVISYQIYAYQETPDQPPNIDLWKKIGDVNALPLPMACSLTYLSNGQKYHFIVRAVDVYTRVGPFSTPESMYLKLI